MERGAIRPMSIEPICPRPSFLTGLVAARVNRLSDGRKLTVSAGRLAKSLRPLNFSYVYVSLAFDVRQEKRLLKSENGHLSLETEMKRDEQTFWVVEMFIHFSVGICAF